MKGISNKRYRDLMEISNLYLRGEKTLDEVVDAIRLMLAYDMWTKMFEEADLKSMPLADMALQAPMTSL